MNLGGVIRLNKSGVCVMICGLVVLYIYLLSGKSSSTPPSLKINLKHLLKAAVKAAENGGNEVERNKKDLIIKKKGLTKEGLEDSVTSADFLSHCVMVKTLEHAYPTLNIISEEAKTQCDKNQEVDYSDSDEIPADLKEDWVDIKDVTVWVDPLDATYEYTGKLYDFVTTMVCVAIKGEPMIGVIHKPFSKSDESHTFWAWVGHAKSTNLHYEKSEGNNLKIIVSMSHAGKIKTLLTQKLKEFELISAAGAGYKSLEVALGKADAYVHITEIKKWDICAGNAIINAMGGKMTTKYGKTIDYTGETSVENNDGLVATMKNHELFIGKV